MTDRTQVGDVSARYGPCLFARTCGRRLKNYLHLSTATHETCDRYAFQLAIFTQFRRCLQLIVSFVRIEPNSARLPGKESGHLCVILVLHVRYSWKDYFKKIYTMKNKKNVGERFD